MSPERNASSFIIFIALSVLLHIAAGAAIYFLAPKPATPLPEKAYIVSLAPPEPAPPPLPGAQPPSEPKIARVLPRPSAPSRVPERMPPAEGPPPKELSARGAHPPEKKTEEAVPAMKGVEAPPRIKEEPPAKEPGYSPAEEARKAEDRGEKGKLSDGEKQAPANLFDKDVIAGVVEKGKESKPPDSSVTFDTAEARQWGYMQRLKERIEYIWEYPPEAAMKGIYGDLVIKFGIKKDGELGAVELVRTSGWRDLDRAAIKALKDGAPYWPLPKEWETESLTVTGHFVYTLYGNYYIR